MTDAAESLLEEIEAFLTKSDMGVSYFGKVAAGNSELVTRLRNGSRVWPETAEKVRAYISKHDPDRTNVDAAQAIEGRAA